VIVRLSGGADAARALMAVVDDPLPAGLEIEAVLTAADAQGEVQATGETASGSPKLVPGRFAFLGALTTPSVQEKRDDRFLAAMTLKDGERFALAYVARAVTPGDFFLPGAATRDMYRPSVEARTAPGRLRVLSAR
jgi:uncharacterized protein YfaS (alpha-2-macroglobulin family)